MNVQTYLESVKLRLAICLKIRSVEIADERIISPTHGYFRARLILMNGDFLELSEYFVSDGEKCTPKKYRYQLMDKLQTHLIRRWDNAPHFPDLPGYPDHVHIGNENNVSASKPLNIIELIQIIESEF